jgi:MerR family transcriptional regulator, thiopeptide resistance regulator
MAYTVGDVARIARISVRTLHHYDEIALVCPTSRSEAGYRRYTAGDLERLQEVLFYRALGFPLAEIARLLADPTLDRRRVLMTQRELLLKKADEAQELVSLIDKTIAALDRGDAMGPEKLFEGFDPSAYEEEAKQRWGDTPEYKASVRKTRGYTKEDWTAIGAESAAIGEALVAVMEVGVPPSDPRAMDLAERHRQHVSRWFYTCTYEVHVGLGEMYVADPRFAANYETRRAGLAHYVREAIEANAARARP